MLFSKYNRLIQICMFILTLLILPLGIPFIISAIIVFILIACALVDLVQRIYFKMKKAYKLNMQCLASDLISLAIGVIVLYIDLILFTFQGIKMSN